MPYAARTQVPEAQSRTEIERTLRKYGADRFMYFSEPGRAIIIFEAANRRIKFALPLPTDARNVEQVHRQRWRALLLCVKSKLESVESGIESFEQAFLAHVVLPNGETVGDEIAPRIDKIYQGEMLPLLPAPRAGK